jgi:TetR/AcrR family transcriptional repressor of nem operon
MSDALHAILDATERRMRMGGFHGFSFREIAADVGIKSSSVHYYFPSKEKLAAAVTKRYTQRIDAFIDGGLVDGADTVDVWVAAFRGTLQSDDRMCPATVLGAAARDLPVEVASEVKGFFQMCLVKLEAQGFSPGDAAQLLTTITGAMVIANALDDVTVYDRATHGLMDEFRPTVG